MHSFHESTCDERFGFLRSMAYNKRLEQSMFRFLHEDQFDHTESRKDGSVRSFVRSD